MAAKALQFEIVGRCSVSKAKAAVCATIKCTNTQVLTLPHGPVETPVFMPVATAASLKGITPEQLDSLGCKLCLNNTYHLYYLVTRKWTNERGLRPGQKILDTVGGAHKFQSWNNNLLTDSGGFQMVSLLKLAHITEVRRSLLQLTL